VIESCLQNRLIWELFCNETDIRTQMPYRITTIVDNTIGQWAFGISLWLYACKYLTNALSIKEKTTLAKVYQYTGLFVLFLAPIVIWIAVDQQNQGVDVSFMH